MTSAIILGWYENLAIIYHSLIKLAESMQNK